MNRRVRIEIEFDTDTKITANSIKNIIQEAVLKIGTNEFEKQLVYLAIDLNHEGK